jgi:FkbM family methyltransferase
MGRPKAPVPDFDDQQPWGAYPPSGGVAAALSLAHSLPPALSALTKLLRRPVKYSVATPLDLTVWGLKLRLLPRGNMSEQKLYTAPQLFDRDEFALLQRRLKPGGVFVDIGANAGIYSFWAHRCMQGQGRILAVEPDPEMRRRLAFNAATNGLSDIDVCPVALSDHEGTAELQVNPRQRGQNTLDVGEAQRAGGTRESLTVPLTTLLALLQSKGVARVDVLKIDIEGHEPPVLRHFLTHAPESMWPQAVISEFKDQTAGDILDLLAARGYQRRETTKLNFILERG